ncbi:MAG TPA: D-cysteine desulfhydrase family protein [Chloroflexota bacterium]|nr:D-cysteine desulfhydrase family protein [Chloroflexota bacterium]
MQTRDRTSPPLTPEQIRELIDRVPRVRLTPLPTPLQECPRLSAALGGPRILVKRDDLTGLAFGGNKTRNLEFRMAEARDLGADVFIAGLEVQSNSARQTTAAANVLGMKPVLLLRVDGDWDCQGNLLVDLILGADIHFLESDSAADMDRKLRELAEEYRRRGHRPYVMNHAGGFALGSALAYILSTLEVIEQTAPLGAKPTHLYMSSGSKGQAGLELARRLLGADFRVVGISARANASRLEDTARIANDAADRLGVDVHIQPDDITNFDEYAAPGYGKPSEAGLEAIRLMARTEGLLLDPIYTGKAMAGLVDHVRRGLLTREDTVVFMHTGGLPALFAHKDAIVTYMRESR